MLAASSRWSAPGRMIVRSSVSIDRRTVCVGSIEFRVSTHVQTLEPSSPIRSAVAACGLSDPDHRSQLGKCAGIRLRSTRWTCGGSRRTNWIVTPIENREGGRKVNRKLSSLAARWTRPGCKIGFGTRGNFERSIAYRVPDEFLDRAINLNPKE